MGHCRVHLWRRVGSWICMGWIRMEIWLGTCFCEYVWGGYALSWIDLVCSSVIPGVYFNHNFSLGLFQIHESFVADGGLFTNLDMQSIFHTRVRRTQHPNKLPIYLRHWPFLPTNFYSETRYGWYTYGCLWVFYFVSPPSFSFFFVIVLMSDWW